MPKILVPQNIDLKNLDKEIAEITKAIASIEVATCPAELPEGLKMDEPDFDTFKAKCKKEADEAIDRKTQDKDLFQKKIDVSAKILKTIEKKDLEQL